MRSSNCVIDSRWVCKLTDFGMERVHPANGAPQSMGEHAFYTSLYHIFKNKDLLITYRKRIISLTLINEAEIRSESRLLAASINLKVNLEFGIWSK